MKIQIDLSISSTSYNDAQMELLRCELRRQMNAFIFKVTDSVKTPGGASMRHDSINIDGTIKLEGS